MNITMEQLLITIGKQAVELDILRATVETLQMAQSENGKVSKKEKVEAAA